MNGVELHRLKMQHRILRVLTSTLPSLQLSFQEIVRKAISGEIAGGGDSNGRAFRPLVVGMIKSLIVLTS